MIKIINLRLRNLDNQFTRIEINISSVKSHVNICQTKVCIAIDRLSIIWKSDLPDKTNWDIFQALAMSILLHGCTT